MENQLAIYKKSKLKYIQFVLYVFTFLFAPPIIPNVNFVFVNFVIALINIIFKYRKQVVEFFSIKSIKTNIKIMFMYIAIFIISILINGLASGDWYFDNYFINAYSIILAFPVVWICSMYIIFKADELNMNMDDIVKVCIMAGLLQGFICIITLLSPTVKEILVKIMYKNTGDKLLASTWVTARRFYGFANNMLDLFGFGTGILCVLTLYKVINNDKKYIFALIIMLLLPLLNSRSGLIIFIAGVVVISRYALFKDIKKSKIFIIISVITVMICIFAVLIVQLYSPETMEWILNDFASFFSDNEEIVGTADALFSENFWTLPSIENMIFGAGHNVSGYSDYSVADIAHSDVGYVNELWKTGIIGSVFLYLSFYQILKNAYNSINDKLYKSLFIFLGLSIIIFLVKACIHTYNTGIALIYILSLFSIYNDRKKEKLNNE